MDRDPSPLYNVARSLMDVQAVFGPIPKIVGKGHCAQVSSSQPLPPSPMQSKSLHCVGDTYIGILLHILSTVPVPLA